MTAAETRLHTQGELDALKTAAERNVLGQFATPPSLARDIVEATVSYMPEGSAIRFLEPAIGTGSFYESLIGHVNGRVKEAIGIEIDPVFANASQGLWQGNLLKIINDDFTQVQPSKLNYQCNLLITNPPYVRHHHIEGERKKELVSESQRASGIKVSGLAGLYVHFMLLAHKWLAEDAISSWLIPSEFMDVNYGEGLKRYLTERVELLRIHRFCPEDVQFDDALVTSTVVIFRKRTPNPAGVVSYTFGPSLADPTRSARVSIAELVSVRKWSALPNEEDNVLNKPSITLGEAFSIRRGLATGDNNFFIRSLAEFEALGINREFLKPILPSPRMLKASEVQGDENGYPILDSKIAVLDCPLPEEMIREKYPKLWSYLAEGKSKKVNEGYLASGRKPWYSQERREPPPLVCTYMGRQREGQPPFRIIRNKSRAVATNVYLLLYPKPWLIKADADGSLMDRIATELRLLGSSSFLAEGRVYGGGLHKIEPKELARLPLHLDELLRMDQCDQQSFAFERRRQYRAVAGS